MDTQTLQRLRTELEAASTLHLALGRIAQRATPNAPTAWTGPLLEELEELAADDGSFSHASLAEIRRRSGAALVAQFHAVVAALSKATPAAQPGLQELLNAVLVTGTQDASIPASASIPGVLSSLSRSAGLQLEATMRAAMLARDGLPVAPPPAPKPTVDGKKRAPKSTATAPRPKKKPGRRKPVAPKKKPAAQKPVAKKPAVARQAAAAKKPTRGLAAKKPTPQKKKAPTRASKPRR
jgi:outer membrane biosynthesis protein TonB